LRTSSTSRDAEFLLHRPLYNRDASTDCPRGFHGGRKTTRQNILGGVCICMLFMTTSSAVEHRLREATHLVDVSADGTRLRGVSRVDLANFTTKRDDLVLAELNELSPSGRLNTPVETFLLRTTCAAHVPDLQLLDEDDALVLGVPLRLDVQKMFTLTTDLAMNSHHSDLRLLSVLGSFLLPGDVSLRSREPFLGEFQMSRVLDDASVRVGEEVNAATIDADGCFRGRDCIRDLDLAHDRAEPLVTVALDRANLLLSFDGSVNDGTNVSDLWKAKRFFVEMKLHRVRLGEANHISIFSLPTRFVSNSLETPLPRQVEINECLSLNIARNVSKPYVLRAQTSQLIDLVEGCEVATVSTRMCETNESLLECDVPEEAQSVTPSIQPSNLLNSWIYTVTKTFVDDHRDCLRFSSRMRRISSETEIPSVAACLRNHVSSASPKLINFFFTKHVYVAYTRLSSGDERHSLFATNGGTSVNEAPWV
jgi:hypothetical protein